MDLIWNMPLPLLYLWIVIILMDFGCIALYVWTLDMNYVLNGVFFIVLWSYIYVMHYKLLIYIQSGEILPKFSNHCSNEKVSKTKVVDLEKLNKVGIQKFSFDLGNSRKITNDIIFRQKIIEIRSKSPKFLSESIKISFFEFEFPFRSELANFGEISTEISFPANGGIRKKNEKVNPAHD